MPPYPGLRHSMEISNITPQKDEAIKTLEDDGVEEDWAAQYQEYLNEKEAHVLDEGDDPRDSNNAVEVKEEDDDWGAQYAKYCTEKENEFFDSYKIKEL
eukprot:scaffold766_cov210-Alexandrium_tamarense.AAC.37